MFGRSAVAQKLSLAALLVATPALAQEEAAELGDLTPEQQVAAIQQQGAQQFADGDYEAAAQTFTVLVNAFERSGAYNPGPVLLRAKAYKELEEYEAALEDLKTAQQYATGSTQAQQVLPEIQNTRAEVYIDLGAYQAALPDLEAAVAANRANPLYQFNLGKCLVSLGGAEPGEKALTKYLDAVATAEQAAEDGAEDAPTIDQEKKAEALRLRGQAFGGLRKFDEARADLADSLEIEEKNHEVYFALGQIALTEEDYEQAADEFDKAIAYYEPEDEDDELPFVQGMLTRASVLEELGKEAARDGDETAAAEAYTACLEQCEKLLDLVPEDDPRSPQIRMAALFRSGVAERLLGDLGEAVKSFSKALEIDPAQGDAYFRRGICFFFMGEEKLAVRDFEQAASINFDSPRSNLWKGMAHAQAGEYGDAIRAYGESIAVSDRYTPAYVNRGLAHHAERDFEKAIADFNEAIRLQPTEAMHYYRRGKSQSDAGLAEKAIRSYMNAIEFDPELGMAYANLITELETSGQAALAAQYRQRVSELGL